MSTVSVTVPLVLPKVDFTGGGGGIAEVVAPVGMESPMSFCVNRLAGLKTAEATPRLLRMADEEER